ncbi:OLC1v1006362C1 [Oldenlandia corymbosa var. corymbosa]|uniref:PRA1 family protein n=1 Tax=Oldenlandia corymbosa var. corymbosa TaxID=529605 RepID=A0AAV1DGV8_OLDCO|nr:OLC1v1006362C1 [Oldenlandia corymbosa var. corymbosa]
MSSSSSSHYSLPISDPKAQAQPHPAASIGGPALGAFLTRLSNSLRRLWSRQRPWLELVDYSAVSRPASLSEATTRIRKNISYFRVNYVAVFAAVIGLSLVSHPFSLFTLAVLLAAWLFLYLLRPSDQPVVLLNRTFTNGEILAILVALTVFVIFLTNVGSLLMSASLIGFGIVCVHGAFRDPEDLFLDDQELPGSGLFSMISGAAASVSVAAPAAVSQV